MKINESMDHRPTATQITECNAASDIAGARTHTRASSEQARLDDPARASIDTSKVNHIRQQIADGNYRIDVSRIADSLMSTARELFSRHH